MKKQNITKKIKNWSEKCSQKIMAFFERSFLSTKAWFYKQWVLIKIIYFVNVYKFSGESSIRNKIIELKKLIFSEKPSFQNDGSKNVLDIQNLRVSFKQKGKKFLDIIRGVDISLAEGQIIGIVGESGSGKSVSTKALMNVNWMSKTTCDSLSVFGQTFDSYEHVNWDVIRGGQISYIPQNPMTSMNPSRKISKQIYDVLEIHRPLDFVTTKERKAYTISILERFKIENPERTLASYPHELSGGMKQRIIIAMGIMAGAKIIIADEPTTALDSTVQASVLELLQEVNREFKLSVIFISHNIAVVAKLCTYIYVMYAGRVVEKAPVSKLFTHPKHPYTWALMASIPEDKDKSERLYTIPGTPVDMSNLPIGDPFAPRNEFALAIDFKQEPPLFEVSEDHWAATWTLHPAHPGVKVPDNVVNRIAAIRKVFNNESR